MNKADKKSFSIGILRIGDNPFTMETFDPIDQEEKNKYKIGDDVVGTSTIIKNSHENRFISLYFVEGATHPRPKEVRNIKTDKTEENPRSEFQIEEGDQMFVLIDVKTQRIFLSDYRKRNYVCDFLLEKLNEVASFKNIVSRDSLDEFKSIKSVKFSAPPNMFTQSGRLGEILTQDIDNYGVGIKRVEVALKFSDNRLPDRLKSTIKKLISEKENQQLDTLIVSGKSDRDFERIYNTESIIDKVHIDIVKGESGLYEPGSVFIKLIHLIK